MESLDYSKFIWSKLPDFLRSPLGTPTNQSILTFSVQNSRIRALASTRDAGVGFGGATKAVLDEFEYHDYAEENYPEIMAMINTSGGQFIILSTANKLRIGTKFKELYAQARSGESSFFKVFLPYDVLPERTPEWYEDQKKVSKTWEIECHYPRNENEALTTLKTVAFFDLGILESMEASALGFPPLEHDLSNKYKGLVKIFRLPEVGEKYIAFADPSDGKDDPHAIIVIKRNGEQVAESHGKTPADLCAQIFDELARYYNNAFNDWETNAKAGGIFSEKIKQLDTPNQAPFIKPDGTTDPKKTGWWTSKSLKDKMVWGLEEAVRQRQVIIYSKDCLNEFKQFIIPEGEAPRATPGAHDDYVMAWGGVWQLRKYMPVRSELKISSYEYQVAR